MLQYSYKPNAPPTPRHKQAARQNWITYSPISCRPPIRWPDGARVALWICPNILYFEYLPPEDDWLHSWARMPAPDIFAYGRQDYGPRVGFWRMLEVLDRREARCTAVVNSRALRRFPDLCAAAAARGWDFVGHGICNTRFIYGLAPEDELNYHRAQIAEIHELTGTKISGVGGPGPQAATENTPDLLAEAGFTYYTDFFCDDQPFPINVRSGRLVSLPYTLELNDPPFLSLAFEADQFAEAVKRQFDVLYREGAASGRVMCISLHPYLFGQPQRARYLDEALKYVMSHSDVWHATGSEIVSHYMQHHYDEVMQHLEKLAPDSPHD